VAFFSVGSMIAISLIPLYLTINAASINSVHNQCKSEARTKGWHIVQ
jgi:hypothetical protein